MSKSLLFAAEGIFNSCSLRSHGASFEENSKYALSRTLRAPDDTKITQQGDSLKSEKGAYSGENDSKVNSEVREGGRLDSNLLSEASKRPLKQSLKTEQYNLSSNQKQPQKEHNFITLSQISETEKIEIIQTGFQLQAEGKLSLKKYYESAAEYSLFQRYRYSIKYETIRRTQLYQQLKI